MGIEVSDQSAPRALRAFVREGLDAVRGAFPRGPSLRSHFLSHASSTSDFQEPSSISTPRVMISIDVIRRSLLLGWSSGTRRTRRPLCLTHTSLPSRAFSTIENKSRRNWEMGISISALYSMYIKNVHWCTFASDRQSSLPPA